MKTFRNFVANLMLLLLLGLFSGQLNAQQTLAATHAPEVNTSNYDSKLFLAFAEDIAFEEDIDYRKRLRASKIANETFRFSHGTYSETEILKYFKRAANRSKNEKEFTQYFLDRDLNFINSLDHTTINEIYQSMRPQTFNGKLDEMKESLWY